MTHGSKEFHDIMSAFEAWAAKAPPGVIGRLDRGHRPEAGQTAYEYYQDGKTDAAFRAYYAGYAQGRVVYR